MQGCKTPNPEIQRRLQSNRNRFPSHPMRKLNNHHTTVTRTRVGGRWMRHDAPWRPRDPCVLYDRIDPSWCAPAAPSFPFYLHPPIGRSPPAPTSRRGRRACPPPSQVSACCEAPALRRKPRRQGLDWVGFAQLWRGEEAQRRGGEQRKEEGRRERRGRERETGTGSALEIWTPEGVTVTRRETGEMGTEWNGARETGW